MYNFQAKSSRFRRKSGNIRTEYRSQRSVPAGLRRKFRGYQSLWLHKYQQERHDLPGKEPWQIPEAEPWYVYKYAAGKHTRSFCVDNSLLHGELPRSLSDDVHNHR